MYHMAGTELRVCEWVCVCVCVCLCRISLDCFLFHMTSPVEWIAFQSLKHSRTSRNARGSWMAHTSCLRWVNYGEWWCLAFWNVHCIAYSWVHVSRGFLSIYTLAHRIFVNISISIGFEWHSCKNLWNFLNSPRGNFVSQLAHELNILLAISFTNSE